MTWSRGLLILLLLSSCGTVAAPDPVNAVKARERQWLDAYERRDTVAMTEMLHDDFVITYPNGSRQDKRDVLEFLEKAAGKPAPRFDSEATSAHVSRGVVVLTGIVVTTRNESRTKQLYTDTYVFSGGAFSRLT